MTMTRCGTQQGYHRHRNTGTRPCPACCTANTDYIRSRRILTDKTAGIVVPARVLGLLLRSDPDALRQAVAELGQRTVDAAKAVSARTAGGASCPPRKAGNAQPPTANIRRNANAENQATTASEGERS